MSQFYSKSALAVAAAVALASGVEKPGAGEIYNPEAAFNFSALSLPKFPTQTNYSTWSRSYSTNMVIPPHGPRVDDLQKRLKLWAQANPKYSSEQACAETFEVMKDIFGGYNKVTSKIMSEFKPASIRREELRQLFKQVLPDGVKEAYKFLKKNNIAEQDPPPAVLRLAAYRSDDKDVEGSDFEFKEQSNFVVPQTFSEEVITAERTLAGWRRQSIDNLSCSQIHHLAMNECFVIAKVEEAYNQRVSEITQEAEADAEKCIKTIISSKNPFQGFVNIETIPYEGLVCADYVSVAQYCLQALGVSHAVSSGTLGFVNVALAEDSPFRHVWITVLNPKVIFDPTADSFDRAWNPIPQSDSLLLMAKEDSKREVNVGGYIYTFDYVDGSLKWPDLPSQSVNQYGLRQLEIEVFQRQLADAESFVWGLTHSESALILCAELAMPF